MGQTKVAEAVAAAEFSRMCAANRIDEDESDLDSDEIAEWHAMRKPIVRDICRGKLVIDEQGCPVWTTEQGKALVFRRATTATFMALQTYGKGRDVDNMIAALGQLVGAGKGELSDLKAPDFHGCSRMANLFLADR